MKEFLIENYLSLINLGCSLICLVIFLLKKAKIVKKDTAFEKVLSVLPSLIIRAEKSGKTGPQKKAFVVSSALCMLSSLLDEEMTEENISFYSEKLGSAVEDILSTPIKKMEVKDEK